MLGKSWLLGVHACVRAILYPGSRILVAAKIKKQAKLLITSKIMDDIYHKSEALRREIKSLQNNNNECRVEFHNGSIIEAVVSTDEARGYRSNTLIIDEYRLLPLNMVDTVLLPFLNTPRQPGFLKYDKYKGLVEPNSEIYISSGGWSSEWSYDRLQETIKGMIDGDKMFACSMSFPTALEHDLNTVDRIKKEMKKESMGNSDFLREYCGLYYKESDGAFFKSSMITPCRTLTNVFYPPSNIDYLKYKNSDVKPYKIPKLKGEIRILSCDIAVAEGIKNDNSVYMCIRLYCDSDGSYVREVSCIESYNGKEAESQAIRIKELFDDFDADYIILDTNGAGLQVWTHIQKENYDINRDVFYDAYTCFNEDNTVDKDMARLGIPVVYSMKAYAETNHRSAMKLRDSFMSQTIRLPITSVEAKNIIFDTEKVDIDNVQKKIQLEGELLQPFEQTDVMTVELINLEHEIKEGKIKLKEKYGMRKDRSSALLYGNFLCDYFESELYKKKNKKKSGFLFLT